MVSTLSADALFHQHILYVAVLQEECVKLLEAIIDNDEEVLSTLINDGVDMNAVIHEVCYTALQMYKIHLIFIYTADGQHYGHQGV